MTTSMPPVVPRPEDGESLAPPSWLRRGAWFALAAAWVALFLSLATFSSADWPSRSVAFHNEPTTNLLGAPGALVAHWTYLALGPGIWLAMAALAWMLMVLASGRVLPHPLLRLFGVLLMAVCASALAGWWMPSLSPVVGAEGGLLPAFLFDELAARLTPGLVIASLLMGVFVGALVAVDELVVAIPALVGRTLALGEPLMRLDWSRFAPRLPRLRRPPSFSAAGATAASHGAVADRRTAVVVSPALTASKAARRKMTQRDLEVRDAIEREQAMARAATPASVMDDEPDSEDSILRDEALQETDGGDGDSVRGRAERFEEDGMAIEADEGSEADADGLHDADLAASDGDTAFDAADEELGETSGPDSAAAVAATPGSEPLRRLSAEELRERIARLPVRMAGRRAESAREEDIPRAIDYSGYQFPPLEMLEEPEGDFSETMEAFVREQAQVLTEALRTYQIDGEVTGIESGPVVTLYSVELAPGTRVARLETIAKDIARSLQAPNIRIIPNMVGRTAVGIEVPNRQKERVRLKELMSRGHSQGMILPMFLGKDSAGEPLVVDLTRMPHMLIAGTTGSGKSVCMNTIIMGWLYTKRPDELKLVLVDPKMVEMSQFSDIPHLMCPVVTDMSKAAGILEWATEKMEERYELLKDAGVRDIRSYNDLGEEELVARLNPQNDLERARIPRKLPYLVFVIDELADLMMTNKEVEHSIVRIAQKARAVGIHLIVATQRPQANVVTGLIKSNMPCRISFKVASGMDSRIVLDQKGAELLLGQGDMLVLTPSSSELRRAQGTLVTDQETRSVARFLKTVAAPSFERQLMAIRGPGGRSGDADGVAGDPGVNERDPLFDRAVEIMIESGRGSVSLLQRRLAIGYGRASRLVDQMGLAGILSDHKGSVAREVLITPEDWHRMKAMEASDAAEAETFDAVPTSATAAPSASGASRLRERAADRELPDDADGIELSHGSFDEAGGGPPRHGSPADVAGEPDSGQDDASVDHGPDGAPDGGRARVPRG